MVKITQTANTFKLNGRPYQKGAYELNIAGNSLGISRADGNQIQAAENFAQWRDEDNNTFSDIQSLLDYCETTFFLSGRVAFSVIADNYTALITYLKPNGTLAYVYNAQGAAWLPGSMGGTYYPNGVYVVITGTWVSARDAIAGQLDALINADVSINTLKADKTDYRFPTQLQKDSLVGTNGVPSSSNKYVTNSDSRNSDARAPLVHTHIATDIIEDVTHRFATDLEKAAWNAKQNALGFTPENIANKGATNGYAPLDATTKIPAVYLPATDAISEGITNLYFTAARVRTVVLTGLSLATGGAITATDTILVAFGKLQNQITNLSTSAVAEGSNLYFTTARVLATALTGYVVGSNAVLAATDTILAAFGKVQAQITAILSQKGAASGIATLDAGTKIPFAQLPLQSWLASTGGGSAPAVETTLKVWRGRAVSAGGGVATFNITADGLAAGTALFINLAACSLSCTGELNSTNQNLVPKTAIKAVVSGKQVTVNVVDTSGALGAAVLVNGITVNLLVIGN